MFALTRPPQHGSLLLYPSGNGGPMARLIPSVLMIVILFVNGAFGAGLTDSFKAGKAELKSAAQLAFGPEGILFVGDSRQAAVFAIATEDTKPAPAANIEVKGINE